VDIGSSRIKLVTGNGAFSNEASFSYEFETLAEKLSIALKNYSKPGRVLVANVAGEVVAEVFQNYCMNTWSITPEFLAVKPEWGGINNAYKNPQQLGIDRWLIMIAAWDKYKSDVCVVDCGTAITVDILTREG
jgi:type III pantothenate kinase